MSRRPPINVMYFKNRSTKSTNKNARVNASLLQKILFSPNIWFVVQVLPINIYLTLSKHAGFCIKTVPISTANTAIAVPIIGIFTLPVLPGRWAGFEPPILRLWVECSTIVLLPSETLHMEQRALKNVDNCLNANIYSYLETSGGQSSSLHLNVHFFNTSVN